MRALFMTHAYIPHTGAGAEVAAHGLLRALAAAGHTVDVLLSENRGPAEPYELDGVRVWPFVDTGDPFRWVGESATDRADVIVSQLQNTIRAAVLASIHRIPHVHLIHNDMAHTRNQVARGPANLVVYNTRWVRASIEARLADVPRGIVVHPPVRAADFGGVTVGDCVTQVNLFAETKNPGLFYRLADRFPDRAFLAVLGAYGVQDVRERPNVEFVGPFPPAEMAGQVYARTKVLLQPSTYESYGLVSVEACAAGVPVIASCAPGLAEALGAHGTCVDVADVDAWEAELRKLLSPRGFAAGVKRAKAVAAALTTEADLTRWVTELEHVARTRVSAP